MTVEKNELIEMVENEEKYNKVMELIEELGLNGIFISVEDDNTSASIVGLTNSKVISTLEVVKYNILKNLNE